MAGRRDSRALAFFLILPCNASYLNLTDREVRAASQ